MIVSIEINKIYQTHVGLCETRPCGLKDNGCGMKWIYYRSRCCMFSRYAVLVPSSQMTLSTRTHGGQHHMQDDGQAIYSISRMIRRCLYILYEALQTGRYIKYGT
jgi:hypothetical protein